MNGIKIEHYDLVEDIIIEALDTLCGISDISIGIPADLEADALNIGILRLPSTGILSHDISSGM